MVTTLSGILAVVTGFSMAPGGGFIAMVAARQAGMAVICGGTLGTGPFADRVRQGLALHNITVARQADAARDTGCCTVLIEPSGEPTFVAAEGAKGHMGHAALAEMVGGVLLSGYSLHYAGSAAALPAWIGRAPGLPPVVLDPSPLVAELAPDLLKPVLDRAAWISANRREAMVLTGRGDPAEAALALAAGRPVRRRCGGRR